MVSYQTFESRDTFFLGRWNKNSFSGSRWCKYFSKDATGQNGPQVAYMAPPSSPLSFSLRFLVNSSQLSTRILHLLNLFRRWRQTFFNWLRFGRPRRQKYNMVPKTYFFKIVFGLLVLKTPLSVEFFKSASGVGGLCCTFACPSFFSCTHLGPKTLLASLNSFSFIMSTSRMHVKCKSQCFKAWHGVRRSVFFCAST